MPRVAPFITTIFALATFSSDTAAQSRTRPITTYNDGSRVVRIAARNGYVSVDASQVVDYVGVNGTPGEARLWVDSVRALIRRPLNPEPGEELEVETEFPAGGDRMSVNRKSTRAGSRYRLDFWDRHVINSVYMPVTLARLRAFLNSIEEAAAAADRMRGIMPALPADSADTRPVLVPESEQLVHDLLVASFASSPIIAEVVVAADGTPDSASAYLISANLSGTYQLEKAIPRLRFAPATRRGQPVRVRARFTWTRDSQRPTSEARLRPDSPTAASQAGRVYEKSEINSRPELLTRSEVTRELGRLYPPLLRDAGVGGTVRLSIVLNPDGSPDLNRVEVVSSDKDLFSSAAKALAPKLRFSPAIVGGQPVRVRTEYLVVFQPT